MPSPAVLITRLDACPRGHAGWAEFEDVCVEILKYAFIPPLVEPTRQPRSYSGIDRRDAIFPNRNKYSSTIWGQLYHELGARMIVCEFKNYDADDITKDEVDQTRNYLTKPMGRLALLCCRKEPAASAYQRRNQAYRDGEKVILFLMPEHLKELLYMKERGDDPATLIMDLVERFYMQWE